MGLVPIRLFIYGYRPPRRFRGGADHGTLWMRRYRYLSPMTVPPSLLLLLLLTACTSPEGERSSSFSDAPIDEAPGPITVHPVYHASLVLQGQGITLHVDPHGGAPRYGDLPAPDLVLITDIHGDHLDTTTLLQLDLATAQILAPRAVIEILPKALQARAILVQNGDLLEVKGVQVEGIPMYNRPGEGETRHPKGRGNGYVITMAGQRIYVSGDTEDIPEMRALRAIDLAFVCMNLPYTMSVEQAAAGVLAFKPRTVYPYHYRGQDGLSDVARFAELVGQGDPGIEVRAVDWYAE